MKKSRLTARLARLERGLWRETMCFKGDFDEEIPVYSPEADGLQRAGA